MRILDRTNFANRTGNTSSIGRSFDTDEGEVPGHFPLGIVCGNQAAAGSNSTMMNLKQLHHHHGPLYGLSAFG